MTPDRWKLVSRLFNEALELDDTTTLEAFLETACGGGEELLDSVRGLLEADAHPPPILKASLGTLAADVADEVNAAALPDRIGPYRLVREIGRGGMGIVCLAERDDDQYRRRVALKLVRAGILSDHAMARFRTERQIMADLEHPNIARLYEGGLDQEGRPYLSGRL